MRPHHLVVFVFEHVAVPDGEAARHSTYRSCLTANGPTPTPTGMRLAKTNLTSGAGFLPAFLLSPNRCSFAPRSSEEFSPTVFCSHFYAGIWRIDLSWTVTPDESRPGLVSLGDPLVRGDKEVGKAQKRDAVSDQWSDKA